MELVKLCTTKQSDRKHSFSFVRSFVCCYSVFPLWSERLWIRVKVHNFMCVPVHCLVHSLLYSLLSSSYSVLCCDMHAHVCSFVCVCSARISIRSSLPISVNQIEFSSQALGISLKGNTSFSISRTKLHKKATEYHKLISNLFIETNFIFCGRQSNK